MKLFECQHCRQAFYFENSRCESCGRSLGYLPSKETITALEEVQGGWRALADPNGGPIGIAAMPSTKSATGSFPPIARISFARRAATIG